MSDDREPRDEELVDEIPEEELVPEDDTIIGVAFRWSLAVIVVVALGVTAVVWWMGRPEPDGPEVSIQTAAPTAVDRAQAPAVPFTEIAEEAGIRFVHYNGAYGDKLLPETMGGGAAFFDYDLDGDSDLLLVNGASWPHAAPPATTPVMALYRNDGTGTFEDVTRAVGLDVPFYGQGVAAGDVDGDGRTDLFFTAVGPNRLFLNRPDGFVEATAEAGVAGEEDAWSTAAVFFDYDSDGDLDLFVGNYVQWSKEIDFEVDYRLTGVGRAYGPPQNYEGTWPVLYRNEGDGSFTDVSAEAGVRIDNPATGLPTGKALGATAVDVDRDGLLDLFVANDTVRNFFFHNNGDGTFEEAGEFYGLSYDREGNATGAMGTDSGWYRNDDNLGIAIGNFANEMTSIYVTQDDPTLFVDEAISEGVGAPSRLSLTFGLCLFDADLDGRLDLLQVNGHLEEEIGKVDPSQSYRQPAQLFWNAGLGAEVGFLPVAPEDLGDLARPIIGRAAAYADIDGDGDLDLVLTQAGGPALLLRNDQELGHHWLRVRLVGEPPNRRAVGALVELEAGGSVQRRQVMPSRSYLSQMEVELTFGLGKLESVDSLVVTWPDGVSQTVAVDGVDRLLVVERDVP